MRFVFLSLIAASAFGQSFYGTLRGRVVDPNGGATAAAVITLTDEATAGARKTITNEQGEYRRLALQKGLDRSL